MRVALEFYTFHSTSSHYFKMRPEQLYSKKYLAVLFIENYSSDDLFDLGQLKLKTHIFFSRTEVTASCLGEGEMWVSPPLS